jgi:hypothetical protein
VGELPPQAERTARRIETAPNPRILTEVARCRPIDVFAFRAKQLEEPIVGHPVLG